MHNGVNRCTALPVKLPQSSDWQVGAEPIGAEGRCAMTTPIPGKIPENDVCQNKLRKLLRNLIKEDENPARLIELYFWSNEPGTLDVIRAFVAMTDASRDAVKAFIDLAADPRSIVAKIDKNGCLISTAAPVTETFAMADYMTAGAGGGKRRGPSRRSSGAELQRESRARRRPASPSPAGSRSAP